MRITRAYIKQHPELIFIYGDTRELDSEGGQAKSARGERNTYAIPTKLRRCYNDVSSFFTDKVEMLDTFKQLISLALDKIPSNESQQIMVFPKLGKGFSEMDKRSPKLRAWMLDEIRKRFNDRIINSDDLQ